MGFNAASLEQLSDDDLELLRYVAAVLAAGFPLVALLQLVRVYGQALAQIADAEVRLFHLYVHEPLMRDGVPGLQMAEEMEGLARELLPLASPIMDRVHQRFLAHFVEQDVIGHMEADLEDAPLDLGRLRVAIAFADLAGYTRLTEEEGEEEAVDAVERFVEDVEVTLPDDARVIKTIGDEVMIVGSDAAALVDWAVGFQRLVADRRPLPRIGMHYGPTLYRDGDYYGREVNLAARVAARAAGGEVLVTRPVVELAGRAPRVRAHRRGAPEGLRRRDRAVPRARRRATMADDLLERVRATGLLPAGPTSSCCSPAGATRSACSTSPSRSAARRARCTSTTACARRPTTTRRTAARCASASGSRSRCTARRGPSDAPGNLQAWARDVRYAAATRAGRRRASWRSGTRPPTRPRPCSTGWPPRPGAARCSGMRPRSGHLVRPLLTVTREETGAWCRARGLRWRDDATNDVRAPTRAGACATGCWPRWRRSTRARRPTSCARPSCCARRPRCSTSSSTPRWPGATASRSLLPRRPAAGARAAHRPPAGRGRHRRPVRPRARRAWTTSSRSATRRARRRRRRAGGRLGGRAALRGDAAAAAASA